MSDVLSYPVSAQHTFDQLNSNFKLRIIIDCSFLLNCVSAGKRKITIRDLSELEFHTRRLTHVRNTNRYSLLNKAISYNFWRVLREEYMYDVYIYACSKLRSHLTITFRRRLEKKKHKREKKVIVQLYNCTYMFLWWDVFWITDGGYFYFFLFFFFLPIGHIKLGLS